MIPTEALLDEKILHFLSAFREGTHAVVLYDSPQHKRDLLFSHLKFGAEGNEGLAYVCSEEKPLEIMAEMRKFGLDIDALRSRNRITVSNYDRVYVVEHRVDIPEIIRAFAGLSGKYRSMGFDGLRASAEMSCFFREGKVAELIAYEKALHRRLDFQAEGICAYNIFDLVNSDAIGKIMPIVRAHDPVIILGPTECLILEPDAAERREIEVALEIRA
jgi:hypothetical protein